MCEYGFTEGTDFCSFLSESTGGRRSTDHQLTIPMAKEICMIQRSDIDTCHGRPEGTARKRFNENKKHFIEGEDYFIIPYSELRPFYGRNLSKEGNPNIPVVLLTQSGYLMVVKPFRDDLSWQVQRQLVNSYFRLKKLEI